tara:strand:- start:1197 stop:1898 length:702 start_codon:yes stop_codon:yes gene_type:complete
MKVIGKDIGEQLDTLYSTVTNRVEIELEKKLDVVTGAQETFSNVLWQNEAVTIQLHNGVPTHALPHIFGVALVHVQQRLDLYPVPQKKDDDIAEGPLLRSALRELVLSPAANDKLESLNLDTKWESEQRHQALKVLLRDHDPEWLEADSPACMFAALLYARAAIEHPLWENLKPTFQKTLPVASELGSKIEDEVRTNGWNSPGSCLQSLLAARELVNLEQITHILDRRTGTLL